MKRKGQAGKKRQVCEDKEEEAGGVGRERVCRWFRFAQLAKGKKFRP